MRDYQFFTAALKCWSRSTVNDVIKISKFLDFACWKWIEMTKTETLQYQKNFLFFFIKVYKRKKIPGHAILKFCRLYVRLGDSRRAIHAQYAYIPPFFFKYIYNNHTENRGVFVFETFEKCDFSRISIKILCSIRGISDKGYWCL